MALEVREAWVSLKELRALFRAADINHNGILGEAQDAPVTLRANGKDYFVPLTPEVHSASQHLLRGVAGSTVAFLSRVAIPVIRNDFPTVVTRDDIWELMLLQANRPVTLDAVALAFPQGHFAVEGPPLAELAKITLPEGMHLGQAHFRPDGSLSLTNSAPFVRLLEDHAPTIAQLMTNEARHADPRCHTLKAFTLSACNPDKWSTSYQQLVEHAEAVLIDLEDYKLPKSFHYRRLVLIAELQEAKEKGLLPAVTINAKEGWIKIALQDRRALADTLNYIYWTGISEGYDHHCDPNNPDHMSFYQGVTGPTNLPVAAVGFFGSLSSKPLRLEFPKKLSDDPALFNAKIEQPTIIASVAIPFSYLQRGIFDHAVFSYTFANAVSFLPRGGIWTGRIYATGEGKPFHQGDNESIRGVASWWGDTLQVKAAYTNEHGGFAPFDVTKSNGVIATGYRSGALAELATLPVDEDGVVVGRTGYSGTISPGSSAAISFADLEGHGFNATEGFVTLGILEHSGPPQAALFAPTRPDGSVIKTHYQPLAKPYRGAVPGTYTLVIEDPVQSRFRFILGRKGNGEPSVNRGDDGEIIEHRTAMIAEQYLGRGITTDVDAILAARVLTPGARFSFAPQTESLYNNDIVASLYLFFPFHPRALDYPRAHLTVFVPPGERATFNLDVDVLHLQGGYSWGWGKVLAGFDVGANASNPGNTLDPRFGVYVQPHVYTAFPIDDGLEILVGSEFRAGTAPYPHDSGGHWEFTPTIRLRQRWNLTPYR